jgi:hypothetical protein
MESSFRSCVEFFGEEPKTATPESFFTIFSSFLKNFDKARKENEKEAEMQKKVIEKMTKTASEKDAKFIKQASSKDGLTIKVIYIPNCYLY